ncbi:MAG: asparagine synthase (glutamine-hydrolyzing) [Rhodospirillales bacterium]|nr:asparagine synthase (glutamine-hydrolyzing) [Rhodospirillales bacterium]
MCGITGYINLDGKNADPSIVRRMADALAHRGPDGQGLHVDGSLALGHRRLKIIDLTDAAHQPMLSDDRQFALVFNGLIYNFRELRKELEARGHRFKSSGDTEVVLNSLMEWGIGALEKFNGMFAIGFWNAAERTLLLARDRYGIKPLYYSRQHGVFVFASEIKSLLQHPAVNASLDKRVLLEYFTFQNTFQTQTLFKDIEILSAGSFMSLQFNQGEVRKNEGVFWDFDFSSPPNKASKAENIQQVQALLEQAVARQCVSDVSVGAYLSSGIDSSAVAVLAAQSVPDLKTYTVGFDMSSVSGIEISFDERESARSTAALIGSQHHETVLSAGDLERCISKLVWHLEEPRVGQSYPNLYAAELASESSKVVLSGTGGDELFAGYPWRYFRASGTSSMSEFVDAYYLSWQRLMPNKQIRRVFQPIWDDVSDVWTREIFENVFSDLDRAPSAPEDFINRSLYFEAKTFLHGLLVVEDKLSMSQGIETRVPFLDNDLVDFSLTVPVHQKLNNIGTVEKLNENEIGDKPDRYFSNTRDGKIILREALKRYLPENVSSRPKQGFSGPDATWFKGESIDFVHDKILSPNARLNEFMEKRVLSEIIHSHMRGEKNQRLLIWSLLNFEYWCEHFLSSP